MPYLETPVASSIAKRTHMAPYSAPWIPLEAERSSPISTPYGRHWGRRVKIFPVRLPYPGLTHGVTATIPASAHGMLCVNACRWTRHCQHRAAPRAPCRPATCARLARQPQSIVEYVGPIRPGHEERAELGAHCSIALYVLADVDLQGGDAGVSLARQRALESHLEYASGGQGVLSARTQRTSPQRPRPEAASA